MISIVIPLYNKAQSITHTLDSVLAQTYTDYEVVVVDDGSTDGSGQVVEGYQSQIALVTNHQSQIRLIQKPNGGVSSARNAGILAAKGEYVAFLDGDDLWDSTYLEELAKMIADYPDAGIYGIGCVHTNGNQLPKEDAAKSYFRGVLTDWFARGGAFTGSSTTIRRDIFDEVGEFDTRMTHGEDMDMWWRVLFKYPGAYYAKPLAFYLQDAENRAMNRLMPLEKHIPYYLDKYADERAKDAAFRKFCDTQMVYRLYPYMFDKRYRKQAKALSKKIDYSQLKFTMWLRMVWPEIYRIYERVKGNKKQETRNKKRETRNEKQETTPKGLNKKQVREISV